MSEHFQIPCTNLSLILAAHSNYCKYTSVDWKRELCWLWIWRHRSATHCRNCMMCHHTLSPCFEWTLFRMKRQDKELSWTLLLLSFVPKPLILILAGCGPASSFYRVVVPVAVQKAIPPPPLLIWSRECSWCPLGESHCPLLRTPTMSSGCLLQQGRGWSPGLQADLAPLLKPQPPQVYHRQTQGEQKEFGCGEDAAALWITMLPSPHTLS
jgi:hypothetical protein